MKRGSEELLGKKVSSIQGLFWELCVQRKRQLRSLETQACCAAAVVVVAEKSAVEGGLEHLNVVI